MRLWENGDTAQAHRAGEEYWSTIPTPPQTDTEILAAQLALKIGKRAIPASPSHARTWLDRARRAYRQDEVGKPLCDFLEGQIRHAEADQAGAAAMFKRAWNAYGHRAFASENPLYRELYGPPGSPTDSLEEFIDTLCRMGDERFDAGDIQGVVEIWNDALREVEDEQQATWLFASVGDAYVCLKQWEDADDAVRAALELNGANEAFVWLRFGQVLYHLGERELALKELANAEDLGGEVVWEDEDPIYREFFTQQEQHDID